MSAILGL